MPEFSIVIPAYNVAEFIDEALDSVISQDFSDWEAVVVDDGSADDTGKIAERCCPANGKFRLVAQENGGLSAARNTGIRCAKGRYLVFLDGDDLLYPGALRKYHQCVVRYGEPDIICGRGYAEFSDDWQKPEAFHAYREIPDGTSTGPQAFVRIVRNRASVAVGPVWNRCYHRRLFQDGRLFFMPGRLHEDEEWSPRVFYRAKSVCFADTFNIFHRNRIGSIMHSDPTGKIASMVQNIQDMTAFLNDCAFENSEEAAAFMDDILFQYASFLIRKNYSLKDRYAALRLRKKKHIGRLLSSSRYFYARSRLGRFLYLLVRSLERFPFLLTAEHLLNMCRE